MANVSLVSQAILLAHWGVQSDRFADRIPVLSTANNLFDLAIKPLITLAEQRGNEAIRSSPYLSYLNHKSWKKCLILVVPCIGQIAVAYQGETDPNIAFALVQQDRGNLKNVSFPLRNSPSFMLSLLRADLLQENNWAHIENRPWEDPEFAALWVAHNPTELRRVSFSLRDNTSFMLSLLVMRLLQPAHGEHVGPQPWGDREFATEWVRQYPLELRRVSPALRGNCSFMLPLLKLLQKGNWTCIERHLLQDLDFAIPWARHNTTAFTQCIISTFPASQAVPFIKTIWLQAKAEGWKHRPVHPAIRGEKERLITAYSTLVAAIRLSADAILNGYPDIEKDVKFLLDFSQHVFQYFVSAAEEVLSNRPPESLPLFIAIVYHTFYTSEMFDLPAHQHTALSNIYETALIQLSKSQSFIAYCMANFDFTPDSVHYLDHIGQVALLHPTVWSQTITITLPPEQAAFLLAFICASQTLNRVPSPHVSILTTQPIFKTRHFCTNFLKYLVVDKGRNPVYAELISTALKINPDTANAVINLLESIESNLEKKFEDYHTLIKITLLNVLLADLYHDDSVADWKLALLEKMFMRSELNAISKYFLVELITRKYFMNKCIGELPTTPVPYINCLSAAALSDPKLFIDTILKYLSPQQAGALFGIFCSSFTALGPVLSPDLIAHSIFNNDDFCLAFFKHLTINCNNSVYCMRFIKDKINNVNTSEEIILSMLRSIEHGLSIRFKSKSSQFVKALIVAFKHGIYNLTISDVTNEPSALIYQDYFLKELFETNKIGEAAIDTFFKDDTPEKERAQFYRWVAVPSRVKWLQVAIHNTSKHPYPQYSLFLRKMMKIKGAMPPGLKVSPLPLRLLCADVITMAVQSPEKEVERK